MLPLSLMLYEMARLDDDAGRTEVADDRDEKQHGIPDLAVALVLLKIPHEQ